MAAVSVWIDQDLCTGDGICIEIAPDVFDWGDPSVGHDQYLAYVKHDAGQKRMLETVPVAEPMLDAVVEAAEVCPGECIFFEVSDG